MYSKIVKRFKGAVQKLAADLAAILDSPTFQVGENARGGYGSIVPLREEVFHDFCALCAQFGLSVPKMEERLVFAQRPEADEKACKNHANRAELVSRHLVHLRGRRSSEATRARVLIRGFALMPSLSGGYPGSISRKDMECLINGLLIEMGISPIRPDYQKRVVPSAAECREPSRPAKVMVVDDCLGEIIKTMRSLAGWPGVNTTFYQYQMSDGSRWNMTDEQKTAGLVRVAKEVLTKKPDIVLMDQGLGDVEGHHLIREIQRLSGGNSILFVANTGGSDDQLRGVGAFENCNKGERLAGLSRALSCLY